MLIIKGKRYFIFPPSLLVSLVSLFENIFSDPPLILLASRKLPFFNKEISYFYPYPFFAIYNNIRFIAILYFTIRKLVNLTEKFKVMSLNFLIRSHNFSYPAHCLLLTPRCSARGSGYSWGPGPP